MSREFEQITIDDVIRETERTNLRHVNDTEREKPHGDITENFNWAMLQIALRLKKYEPTFCVDCTAEGIGRALDEMKTKSDREAEPTSDMAILRAEVTRYRIALKLIATFNERVVVSNTDTYRQAEIAEAALSGNSPSDNPRR